MAKSYTEQLAAWVKRRPAPARRDKNLVAFLAVREDVRDALDQGYAVKTVWAHMRESQRIDFGYDTFLAYVNRHIRLPDYQPGNVSKQSATTPPSQPEANAMKAADTPLLPRSVPHVPTAPAGGGLSGFTFNPAPNIEELM